jgi:hypothetical protein
MIGIRRGWGGSFRIGLLAWEIMKNMRRQHKMLIATLLSYIPSEIDVFDPPGAAKTLSGHGSEPRGIASNGSLGEFAGV